MKGFGIYVKNDLLEPKHVKNMQVNQKTSAIWLYLWFLDKVTKIDKNTNLGSVLGGKPFKFSDFELAGEQATRLMFRNLKKHGYIEVLRTPYGNVVWVTKAVKIFGNNVVGFESARSSQESARSNVRNVQGLGIESARSNKTIQLDNTKGESSLQKKQGHKTFPKPKSNKKPKARVLSQVKEICAMFDEVHGTASFNALNIQPTADLIDRHGIDTVREYARFGLALHPQKYQVEIYKPIDLADHWAKLTKIMETPEAKRDDDLWF
jgi:hypothetical protein